jgi:hypothetical protein
MSSSAFCSVGLIYVIGKVLLKVLKVVENNTKQPGLNCLSFFLDFISTMPRIVYPLTRQ